MPEHDLQPPRFSRQALERILNDWTAVRAMLLSGRRPRPNSSPDVIYEEQLYLESQSGTARLDKFTHCLLVKCSVEVSTKLKLTNKQIWAATWQNQQNDFPPSLIRVFAVRMKKAWVLSYPLSAQWRLWSDWVDAQADLSLPWAHTHFIGFVTRRLIFTAASVWALSWENLSSGFATR